MFCTSINYKSANAEIRKKFAFSPNVQRNFMSELINDSNISQCVILCTCNRTEIYFCGSPSAPECVDKLLAKYSNIKEELMSPIKMFFQGENAIYHLFKVASGIDSMVIGEDEILRQTKNAYITAKELRVVSYELNMLFQSAVACAKKIKTETALSKTSVSIASLAANQAAKLGENINVLLIGATGKTGMTVLKNLMSHKKINILVTLRNHNPDFTVILNSNINTVDYSERYNYIDNADCIISATSSPHYTVTMCELKKNLNQNKKRLFIDLAIPPDIDRNIQNIDGVTLIGIDYFEKLAESNNALKQNSVESAKEIISKDIDSLKKELYFHDFFPYIDSIKNEIKSKSFEDIIYKFKSEMHAEQFSEVLRILKSYGKQ